MNWDIRIVDHIPVYALLAAAVALAAVVGFNVGIPSNGDRDPRIPPHHINGTSLPFVVDGRTTAIFPRK